MKIQTIPKWWVTITSGRKMVSLSLSLSLWVCECVAVDSFTVAQLKLQPFGYLRQIPKTKLKQSLWGRHSGNWIATVCDCWILIFSFDFKCYSSNKLKAHITKRHAHCTALVPCYSNTFDKMVQHKRTSSWRGKYGLSECAMCVFWSHIWIDQYIGYNFSHGCVFQ